MAAAAAPPAARRCDGAAGQRADDAQQRGEEVRYCARVGPREVNHSLESGQVLAPSLRKNP